MRHLALTSIAILLCVVSVIGWQSNAVSGTVRGRVLWNEQPVAGATVYATSEYNFNSTRYGSSETDTQGLFAVTGVPEGQKYLYVFGNRPEYWVTAVTLFKMAGSETVAPDTYLCKGFDPVSPKENETVTSGRPVLQWKPYPNAASYATRVLLNGQNRFIFSRGDTSAPRLSETSVQVDVDLSAGAYTWRVDAFNAAGHIIGCSFYPRTFTVRPSP